MAKKEKIGYKDVEARLQEFKDGNVPVNEIPYKILYAFGKGDGDIKRYKEGKGIVKAFDGLLIKGLFCFQRAASTQLTTLLDALKHDESVTSAAPKIIAVSDGETILAYDMREKETYENPLNRMYCDFGFFYPLMGVERFREIEESPADVKAAEKLARLHDDLRVYNDFSTDDDLHDLNIFIARLLFCFFAEDSGIFESNLFTGSIQRYTKDDGSDLADYIDAAFNVMNVRMRNDEMVEMIRQFPYVNGGLFAKQIRIPKMGRRTRDLILECGELNWQDINPDIFGSMIQAVVNPEVRATEGMHYTSVPNIMKVINPLFLDDLRGEYNNISDYYQQRKRMLDVGAVSRAQFYDDCKPVIKRCDDLLIRMSRMKFFDPACGSGNFLIITYKMLRLLEMDILTVKRKCKPERELQFIDGSFISLNQFYGIELLDFPHEVAMLSLWLAEHQMNKQFHDNFGVNTQALPLHQITQIVCGNACRLDWNVVCPHTKDEEVFVFGNPPYLGSKLQTKEQKDDVNNVFGKLKGSMILDYISCWFKEASQFIIKSNSKFAFVSTNSICQGEQVSILWPGILLENQEIFFAYTSFKWSNNAKYNAGVTVVVIGVKNKDKEKKFLYTKDKIISADNINPYLSVGEQTIVYKETKTPKGLPRICFGCMPYDNGHLLFDDYEYETFLKDYPLDVHFLKRIYGSEEFINEKYRYCLWIDDNEIENALKNHIIAERIELTRQERLNSVDENGRKLAEKPYQFREHPDLSRPKIIIPRVSSEHREYIPMGYLNAGTVVSDSAFAIYDAETWLFGILESKMHMAWVRTVGGKLETRYRYSAQLCYNTFPFPKISVTKKESIEQAAEQVLIARAYHPGNTLAELYNPDTMPDNLRKAHNHLDDIVDSCYAGYPFANDEARLECLFKMYEKMTSKN
jgi:hypothetical protein